MAMVTIHAPSVNFVTSTISPTSPVSTPPVAFRPIAPQPGAPGSPRILSARRTMPNWESVKAVKTPSRYRWIRLLTSALKPTISAPAATARTMMPFE